VVYLEWRRVRYQIKFAITSDKNFDKEIDTIAKRHQNKRPILNHAVYIGV